MTPGQPSQPDSSISLCRPCPKRNQLCDAHLYLGLYSEAAGDAVKARGHITQAAGPFRMGHFMGKVAVTHAKLRGWPTENAAR